MDEGLLVLVGAAIGFAGSVLANVLVIRRDQARAREDALRTVFFELTTCISNWRLHVQKLHAQNANPVLQERASQGYASTRAAYEQLLIVSSNIETQKAARTVIHNLYWMMRAATEQPSDYKNWRARTMDTIAGLYAYLRKELRTPEALYIKEGSMSFDDPPWS